MFTITLEKFDMVLKFKDENEVNLAFKRLRNIQNVSLFNVKEEIFHLFQMAGEKLQRDKIKEISFNGITTCCVMRILFQEGYFLDVELFEKVQSLSQNERYSIEFMSIFSNVAIFKITNFDGQEVSKVDAIHDGKYPSTSSPIFLMCDEKVKKMIKEQFSGNI